MSFKNGMKPLWKVCLWTALAGILTVMMPCAVAQDTPKLPPEWDGKENWKMLKPGDIAIDASKVEGMRWEMRFGSRLHTDDPKQEARVWEAEKGYFNGRPVVLIHQIDKGHAGQENLFPRTTAWYVDRQDFRLLFQLGADPLSEEQRVTRFGSDKVVETMVNKDGTVKTRNFPGQHAVFSYRYYPMLLAAMDLKAGLKFRLPDYDFWGQDGFSEQYVKVDGKMKVKDASGREREVWKVSWMTFSGFLTHYYIGTEAPYYFGQEVRAYRIQDGKVPVYRESPTGFSKLDD